MFIWMTDNFLTEVGYCNGLTTQYNAIKYELLLIVNEFLTIHWHPFSTNISFLPVSLHGYYGARAIFTPTGTNGLGPQAARTKTICVSTTGPIALQYCPETRP